MPCALFAMLSDNPAAAGGGIIGALISLVTVAAAIARWLESRRRDREARKIPPIEVAPQVLAQPAPAPLLPPDHAETRLKHLEQLEAMRATMARDKWEAEQRIAELEDHIRDLEGKSTALLVARAELARAESRAERAERAATDKQNRIAQLKRINDTLASDLDDVRARLQAAEERLRERDGCSPHTRPTTPPAGRR